MSGRLSPLKSQAATGIQEGDGKPAEPASIRAPDCFTTPFAPPINHTTDSPGAAVPIQDVGMSVGPDSREHSTMRPPSITYRFSPEIRDARISLCVRRLRDRPRANRDAPGERIRQTRGRE